MGTLERLEKQEAELDALIESQRKPLLEEHVPEPQLVSAPPPPEPVIAQPQPAPAPQDDRIEKAEHKYKVLEGKYRAEVPRLAADNRDLRQKLNTALAELEELKTRLTKPQESLIKPEDLNKFGEDTFDFTKRVAQEVTAEKDQKISALEKRLEKFEQNNAKLTEVQFYERLAEMVPDWVSINDDESFHAWLEEYDDLTGERRQDLLDRAEATRDPKRAAAFFKAFKQTTQETAVASNKVLAAQVEPEPTRVVTAPTAKPFITRKQIEDFYARVRRGLVSEAEEAAVEAQIHAAIQEGRVR